MGEGGEARMQFAKFVPSAERSSELDLYASRGWRRLRRGDVIWLVTRMLGARSTPALCGRLVVQGTAPNHPADRPLELDHAHEQRRIIADRARSELCEPFPCDAIRSWPTWRDHFEPMAELAREQTACLEAYWQGSQNRRIPRQGT